MPAFMARAKPPACPRKQECDPEGSWEGSSMKPLRLAFSVVVLSAVSLKFGAGFWGPVLMLGGLIFLHEGGHFLAAKYMGMPVAVFSLGFGKRLAGFKWRETDVRLSMLPLGGYVELAGYNPEQPRGEDPHGFLQQPVWKRMLFYSGGILANFATALVLLTIVGANQARVTKAQESWVITRVIPEGAAEQGGLKVGDELRGIEGLSFPSASWDAAQSLIQGRAGQSTAFHLVREGEPLELALTPRLEGGKGRLGFAPSLRSVPLEFRSFRPGDLLVGGRYAAIVSWRMTGQISEFLKRIVTFEAKSVEVVGPIGIVREGSRAARSGWEVFLFMCAAISLQLGLLNALPIPALDGGHMAVLIFEKIRGEAISVQLKEKIFAGGFIVLASLMGLVVILDLVRLGTGK